VVFSCAIGLDFITAALALWVLKPQRRQRTAEDGPDALRNIQPAIVAGGIFAAERIGAHGWHVVFSCAIGLDFITAALALWVLKPWRARFIRQ
jgi:hypothetical protein